MNAYEHMVDRLSAKPCPDCGATFAVSTFDRDCVLTCHHAETCPELARRGLGPAKVYGLPRGRTLTLVYSAGVRT